MINKSYDEKIAAWLQENRERILKIWMDLVRIPSVQAAPQPKTPFGSACAEALRYSAELLGSLGLPVVHNEEDGYAYADLGCGEKSIGLFAHSDVVPVGEGWLYTRPFEPLLKEGMLIGRGAADNKNGIVAAYCVLAMLKELQIPLHNRVRVFVGSNEESGMQDISAYVEKEEMPTLSLVPDSSFPCALGEKGILRMWAKAERPFTAVRSMMGGDAFNIVLDCLDTVLEPNAALAAELQAKCAGDGHYELAVADDGSIHLRANGVAKHAASPEDSVNATHLTAALLASCEAMPREDREILSHVASYLEGYYGENLGIAHEDEAFGHLTSANGMVDMEEGRLKVSLDVRYGTALPPEELEKQLCKSWQDAGFAIAYLENRAGYTADPASPVPATLQAVAEELSGKSLGFYLMRGGTYGRYLQNAFPLGTGILPADHSGSGMTMPAGRGGAHQRDEAANVEAVFLGIRVLMHDVLACDELLNKQ